MARENREVRLMDQRLLRAVGILALMGAALFLLNHFLLIASYLTLAGFAFLIASLGWDRRYQTVFKRPPSGFQFTGERLPNPPDGWVEVWHRGISRVYVETASGDGG